MTKYLPPSLLALFAPRPPLPFKPPVKAAKHGPMRGVAAYVCQFENPDEVDYSVMTHPEQLPERRERIKREKRQRRQEKVAQELATWDPYVQGHKTADARKTLFIARLAYDATERDVEKEFDAYGKIKSVHIVRRPDSGKPRGYAFIEYEEERSMRKAYKEADGTRVKGRRVLVDVERGRTMPDWRPRRLGGGLGKTRAEQPKKEKKDSGRGRKRSRSPDRRGGHRGGGGGRDSYRRR